MASASDTTSLSTPRTWLSKTLPRVGAGVSAAKRSVDRASPSKTNRVMKVIIGGGPGGGQSGFLVRDVRQRALESSGAKGFDQRSGGRPVQRSYHGVRRIGFKQREETLAHDAAAEDAAEIRTSRGFSRAEQLPAHGGGDFHQGLSGLEQNFAGRGVALAGGLVDKFRKRGDARTRKIGRVETMQELIGVMRAGGFEQHGAQRGGLAPAFFEA